MAIRMLTSQLELTITRRPGAPHVVRLNGARLVECDTLDEAEQVKRAFENVLAPRFTRDEAIALCQAAPGFPRHDGEATKLYLEGMRAALEALAWAGVFSDCGGEGCAELAKRPVFTRDEAIAIVKEAYAHSPGYEQNGVVVMGIRLALEALAAAGVFLGCQCGGAGCPDSMSNKLDAAGIK